MYTTTVWETLGVQWQGFSKGELNINDDSGYNEKDEDVHEEVMLAKNVSLKEHLIRDISQHWKCRGQNLGSEFRLGKDYDNSPRQERILALYL